MHRPLTDRDLLPSGPLRRLGKSVHVLDGVDSTNSYLLTRVEPPVDGAVASAEYQSAGRGRLGRQWLAPRGSSVLMSVLLLEAADSPLVSQATMIGCLSAIEAIEATTSVQPHSRWPNDLAVKGRKLGGVLAESRVAGSKRAIVIGIGINCLQQRGHFPPELREGATSLEIESGKPVDRSAIASRLLSALDRRLVAARKVPGFWGEARAEWLERCGDVGERVTLHHDAREYKGTIVDIADGGDLLVQLDRGGRRRFEAAKTTRLW
jgi:BirA family biotin operon repressor/biotin-[acetyl-CoA-carboxylase] ligase